MMLGLRNEHVWPAVLFTWVVTLHAGSVVAQEAPDQEIPDTVQADSAQIRILERLKALAKPPGVDSTLLRDSIPRGRPANAGPRPQPGDSVMAAFFELEGYTVTQYGGTKARFETETKRLILEGAEGKPAVLSQPEMTLTAVDTITLDDKAGLVWTAGETVTDRPGQESVTSVNIIYSLDEERGSAKGAKTRFSQGSTWLMEGDLPYVVADTTFGHKIIFTSCQEEKPHYHFAAREAKVVGGGWLVVRNVTLNFDDVPVLWLPFIFQNVETGRSSGLLTPRFSINDVVRTSRGQTRRISNLGFFWAINDYADATVALDWWSDNFTSLTGGARYNISRRFLDGQVNYRQYWRAEGGTELSFDTRHSWEMSERTQFRASARYASSAAFVRRNSFDPREVTQSIDSEGGLNHRLGWGSLSLNANRRQFLSDDRVEMTLPQMNLSLQTITLFRAPENRARFYNNLTWSGSARGARRISDQPDLGPGETFTLSSADRVTTDGGVSSNLNLGRLSVSQSLNFTEQRSVDVPFGVVDSTLVGRPGVRDLAAADLRWNIGIDYQQRIIGSTTLTPRLSIDGSAKRNDQIEEALSFVSAPTRLSFGAQLKSDLYGFYGGFGPFEAVRHKLSPSFSYAYAPGVVPTDLQETVFGSRELLTKSLLSLSLNQTFEAKRRAPEDTTSAEGEAADSLGAAEVPQAAPGEPTRLPQGQIVNLLSVTTSAVMFDFTRAGEEGSDFVDGFTTTRLQNQIASDFLRGLSMSMEHDLFDVDEEGRRTFSPLLSQLNLSFQMSDNSGIIRALGGLLGRGGGDDEPEPEPDPEEEPEEDDLLLDDVSAVSLTSETTMVPGAGGNDVFGRDTGRQRSRRRGRVGGWSAALQYSLTRSRSEDRPSLQMVQANFRFQPTERWKMSWRTSFNVADRAFNDHTIRLTRDLHRWEANFDFLQTATGNWQFRFQVSLTDNRDLKFDYRQRNADRRSRF